MLHGSLVPMLRVGTHSMDVLRPFRPVTMLLPPSYITHRRRVSLAVLASQRQRSYEASSQGVYLSGSIRG
jgi:hypothetical protein